MHHTNKTECGTGVGQCGCRNSNGSKKKVQKFRNLKICVDTQTGLTVAQVWGSLAEKILKKDFDILRQAWTRCCLDRNPIEFKTDFNKYTLEFKHQMDSWHIFGNHKPCRANKISLWGEDVGAMFLNHITIIGRKLLRIGFFSSTFSEFWIIWQNIWNWSSFPVTFWRQKCDLNKTKI